MAGASVQPALAARAVAWTVQRPGRRLNRGSACVRGSQTMPMSFGWIWGFPIHGMGRVAEQGTHQKLRHADGPYQWMRDSDHELIR